MQFFNRFIGDLFLSNRFYFSLLAGILLYFIAYFVPSIAVLPRVWCYLLAALSLMDYILLFFVSRPPEANRNMSDRLSNSDLNPIEIAINNANPFFYSVTLIDELPVQFQARNWRRNFTLQPWEEKKIQYTVKPTQRGEYHFGNLLFYVRTVIGLLERRHTIKAEIMVPVYPSYMQLQKYQLMSQTTVQPEAGNRRMRKMGHSMEFEQIKEYVRGDDIRTINWKATARRDSLMVNNYTDERSQQVYCIIDKGRLMKMPFNELSLLDYAINSALVLSHVCLKKQDRIGVMTFSNKMGNIIPADRNPIQRNNIQQLLYNQETQFLESDYEMLYLQIRSRIKQRSLLILYCNFESFSGLKRQLNYLRSIAQHHLLLVVFFENTELMELSAKEAYTIEEVYIKTIAEKMAFEKRQIVKELAKYGILAVLTTPEKLTVNTINKYLELKERQAM